MGCAIDSTMCPGIGCGIRIGGPGIGRMVGGAMGPMIGGAIIHGGPYW